MKTLEEIIAAIKAATAENPYDPTADLKALNAAENVGLVAKNKELLSKNRELKAKVDALPEDFDSAKWEELVALEKKVDVSKLDEKAAVEKVKADLTASHNKQVEALNAKNKGLQTALESNLIDNAVTKAIADAGGNATLLLPHIKQRIRVAQNDDGTYATEVIGPDGSVAFSKQPANAGEKMPLSEYIAEFKQQDAFKSAFSAQAGGGGAPPGHTPAPNGVKNPFLNGPGFNRTEQTMLLNTNPDMAQRMMAEANVANQSLPAQPPQVAPQHLPQGIYPPNAAPGQVGPAPNGAGQTQVVPQAVPGGLRKQFYQQPGQ